MIKLIRNKLFAIPVAALACLCQVACTATQIAETGSLVTDTVGLLSTGASDYASVQAALSAGQQSISGHGISLGNIGTLASAILTPTNGQLAANVATNLGNALAVVTSDVTSLINSGASTAAISANLAAAQTNLPAPTSPAASTNTMWNPVKAESEMVSI